MPTRERERGLVANRFRSLFVIGRGGMGSVDVALELGGSGASRIVALKRMLPEASIDRHHIDMFMREARVAEMLSHANVVHAFASGEDERELFLAMEYVEGEPLSRVLSTVHAQEGRIAAPLVAHVLAEICAGLHAAHELRDATGKPLNLIHRDVSPHNVMVAYEGHVKLLDFGVVKIDQLDARGRTKTGEIKGKTAYMSPEQAMGEPLDRRSDLYSLGAVLFESISGQRMWGTGTDFDVLRRLALEEPPRLADAAPNAPGALCDLHAHLVARERDARPPTALAVAEELRDFIASTGTQPDARVVKAVMQRLFPREIAHRREALEHALDEAMPGDESVTLRRSLITGFSETRIEVAVPGAGAGPEAQPVVVRARGMLSIPPPPEPASEPDTEVDAGAGLAGTESGRVVLPLQRTRIVPWAVGAAAMLVLGSVAFMRWLPASSAGPADPGATDRTPRAGGSGAPVLSTSSTSSAAPLPPPDRAAEPTPPRVGDALSLPSAAPSTAKPAAAPSSIPSPKPRTSTPAPGSAPQPASPSRRAPSTPQPLPLDEHPI